MNAKRRPIAIDLFAGAGGLSLGFEQAGFDIAAAVEYDPIHAAIHEINFPYSTTVCDDVTTLAALEPQVLRQRLGVGDQDIDTIIGGPPCQGFSLIGNRVLDDSRNSLVAEFANIVERLQPKTFVMENVPGMATGGHAGLLTELKHRFNEIGYRLREPHQILNAGNFGVPQDRRRLFLLGAREDVRLPQYPEPQTVIRGKKRQAALLWEFGPSVADAIGDLPDVEEFDYLFDTDRMVLNGHGEKPSRYAAILRGELREPEDYSYPRSCEGAYLTGCIRARHTDLSRSRFAATVPGTTEPISRFYRLPADGVSNTLRAGTATDHGAYTAPRPIHPKLARCITVREAARLHSFPDSFIFHRTIWHGFRQIGNAVPPRLGRAVGAEVIEALGVEPAVPDKVLMIDRMELAEMVMSNAAAHFGVSRTVIAPRKRQTS